MILKDELMQDLVAHLRSMGERDAAPNLDGHDMYMLFVAAAQIEALYVQNQTCQTMGCLAVDSLMFKRKKTRIAEILKNQEAKLSKLEGNLALEQARLEGMRLMAEQITVAAPHFNKSHYKPKRRMRLGSKKRAVYQLVADGFKTTQSLSAHLQGSKISARYVRDVVRDALNDEDMHGNLDDRFTMSDFGKERLEKAPVPKDWGQYEVLLHAAPDSLPQNNALVASQPPTDRSHPHPVELICL